MDVEGKGRGRGRDTTTRVGKQSRILGLNSNAPFRLASGLLPSSGFLKEPIGKKSDEDRVGDQTNKKLVL